MCSQLLGCKSCGRQMLGKYVIFGIFCFFFFPSKQAKKRSKQSRNDRATANFDEFNKISYISVIFGPKIMLLGSCEGHGYWSHVQAGRCMALQLQVAGFVDIIFVSFYSGTHKKCILCGQLSHQTSNGWLHGGEGQVHFFQTPLYSYLLQYSVWFKFTM